MARSQPFQPQPGDFCLVSGRPWYVTKPILFGEYLNGDGFGRWVMGPDGIRHFEGFSHAFVVIERDTIVEAEPGGARTAALAPYRDTKLGGTFVSSTWDLTTAQRDRICENALKHVGRLYSGMDYAALFAHRLHLPLPGLRAYVADTEFEICSQQVDDIYFESDLHVFMDGCWQGYVTPMGLFPALTGPVAA